MGRPIPKATPAAIAQNKKEQESRSSLSAKDKVLLNFKKGPDVSQAAKVGEPTLVDPQQTSAPQIVRAATANVLSALTAATASAVPGTGTAPPPENGPAPRSDGTGGTAAVTGDPAATGTGAATNAGVEVLNKPAANPDAGIQELGNDLTPPTTSTPADGTAPPLPPTQVNDAPKAAAPADGSTPAASTANGQPAATEADTNTESSSKKKKKHHFPF